MPQSFSAVYVHLVYSTKNRRPWLRDRALRNDLHAFLGGTSKTLECPTIRVGGVEDHVHALARLGRTISLADWVKELKRVTSLWVKEQDAANEAFAWQNGYAAFSVSASSLDEVERYIANQESHHQKMSFQDEFRALLERHGMTWDERYVWD